MKYCGEIIVAQGPLVETPEKSSPAPMNALSLPE